MSALEQMFANQRSATLEQNKANSPVAVNELRAKLLKLADDLKSTRGKNFDIYKLYGEEKADAFIASLEAVRNDQETEYGANTAAAVRAFQTIFPTRNTKPDAAFGNATFTVLNRLEERLIYLKYHPEAYVEAKTIDPTDKALQKFGVDSPAGVKIPKGEQVLAQNDGFDAPEQIAPSKDNRVQLVAYASKIDGRKAEGFLVLYSPQGKKIDQYFFRSGGAGGADYTDGLGKPLKDAPYNLGEVNGKNVQARFEIRDQQWEGTRDKGTHIDGYGPLDADFKIRMVSPHYVPGGVHAKNAGAYGAFNIHPDGSSGRGIEDGSKGCISLSIFEAKRFQETYFSLLPNERADELVVLEPGAWPQRAPAMAQAKPMAPTPAETIFYNGGSTKTDDFQLAANPALRVPGEVKFPELPPKITRQSAPVVAQTQAATPVTMAALPTPKSTVGEPETPPREPNVAGSLEPPKAPEDKPKLLTDKPHPILALKPKPPMQATLPRPTVVTEIEDEIHEAETTGDLKEIKDVTKRFAEIRSKIAKGELDQGSINSLRGLIPTLEHQGMDEEVRALREIVPENPLVSSRDTGGRNA